MAVIDDLIQAQLEKSRGLPAPSIVKPSRKNGQVTVESLIAQGLNPSYIENYGDLPYERFNPDQYGRGVANLKSFDQARGVFNQYLKIKPGQPGYDNAQKFKKLLQSQFGIADPNKATDRQLFEAMDLALRDSQKDNQKENGFGSSILGKALGFLAPIAGGIVGGPLGGALAGGLTSGLTSGSPIAGLAGAAGGFFGGSVFNKALGVGTGGLLGLPGGSLPGQAINAAKGVFGFNQGGFTNPAGLGLSPEQLYNPASLGGSPANLTQSLAGGGFTNAAGLGLDAAQLFRQPLNNITNYAGGGFFNPDALGIDATDLYNPQSLGGPAPSSSVKDILKEIGKGITSLSGGQQQPITQRSTGFSVPQLSLAAATPTAQTIGGTLPQITFPQNTTAARPGLTDNLSARLLQDRFGGPDLKGIGNFNAQARGQGLSGPSERRGQRRQQLAALV